MAYEVERHGSFFAVDPKFAEEFIEDPDRPGTYKEGGRIIPVYLSIQNPIDLRDNSLSRMLGNTETVEGFEANNINLRSIYNHIYEDRRWELFDGPEGAEFVDNLQKLGFDGAIINERPERGDASGEVWVAFNPNQIKSVNNRGSFSPDDNRLMKEDKPDNICYHVTPAKNVKWIMQDGLIPSIGSASSSYGESEERTYLFPTVDDAEDAVSNWLGDQYEDDILALLQVDTSGLKLRSDVAWEYYTNQAISPTKIKILSMDM
jgi:hypothetical protein